MRYYNTNLNTYQHLNPCQREIYQKILRNNNTGKKSKRNLTRCLLSEIVRYAKSTVSDALQVLKNFRLVYYCRKTKTWHLVTANHDSVHIYDYHIKFKWDWPNFFNFGGNTT